MTETEGVVPGDCRAGGMINNLSQRDAVLDV